MSCSESLLRSCLHLYKFRSTGITRHIDLSLSFKSSAGDEFTSLFLHNLTSTRETVVKELSNPTAITSATLGSLEQYVPYIFQLLDSLQKSESEVYLDYRMIFEWRGGLNTTEIWSSYEEVIFDIIMTLYSKSMLHYKYATELVASELSAETFIQAGRQLRQAAGIMFALQNSILPRWVSGRGRIGTPPETSEAACAALGHAFTAAAQSMAVVKAIQDGTPPAILAKLATAVVKEFEMAIDILLRQTSADHKTKIPVAELTLNWALSREWFQCLSWKYQAQALAATGEAGVGTAIALSLRAQNRLREQTGKTYLVEEPGFPRGRDMPPSMQAGVAELRVQLAALERGCRQENDLIYHSVVPSSTDPLPDLGPGALIMRPDTFEMPQTTPVIFKYEKPELPPPPPSAAAALLSFFTKKNP